MREGYTALKTNIFLLDENPSLYLPGFLRGEGSPELNAERHVIRAMCDQLAAFRLGAGDEMDLLVDLNFNFKFKTSPVSSLRGKFKIFNPDWLVLTFG